MWRFICYLKVLCQKWIEIIFPLIYHNFSSNSSFTLNFVWCFALLLKNLLQTMKKIYPWNFDFCKVFLHMCPETCGTHRSQQAWRGSTNTKSLNSKDVLFIKTSSIYETQPVWVLKEKEQKKIVWKFKKFFFHNF